VRWPKLGIVATGAIFAAALAIASGLLAAGGVTPVRLPAWSPNLKAFAERFVGSVKSECLARMVPLGEGHFRAAVRAFVDHYHEERPH
jgi:putative transposase